MHTERDQTSGRLLPRQTLPDVWLVATPEPNSGCWLWTGYVDPKIGYGRMEFNGKRTVAHRVYWEAENGAVPTGLQLDHLCRVRSCVNPAHPEPVTQQENIRRGEGIPVINARKTHCNHGHEFTMENAYQQKSRLGRRCITCAKVTRREYFLKKGK